MHLRQCVLSVLIVLAVFSRPAFAVWHAMTAELQPSKSRAKRSGDQPPPPPMGPATEGTIASPTSDQPDPNAQGSSTQTGEVKIEVEKFGVGRVARPGEWTGFRIRVFDTSSKPREVLVRLYGTDPDGDIPVAQRDITTNPNTWQGVWLYQRLPFSFNLQDLLSVSCYEAVEVKDSSGAARFEPGRRLGQVRIAPQMLVDSNNDLIAVVGQRMAGLNNYSVRTSGSYPPYSHEPTEIVALGAPSELPIAGSASVNIQQSSGPRETRPTSAAIVLPRSANGSTAAAISSSSSPLSARPGQTALTTSSMTFCPRSQFRGRKVSTLLLIAAC